MMRLLWSFPCENTVRAGAQCVLNSKLTTEYPWAYVLINSNTKQTKADCLESLYLYV